MRKNFPLSADNKQPARVLEGVKHDIRKYFKRERSRDLPPDANVWLFDCKVGASADTATAVRVSEVIAAVDAVATSGAPSVYEEVLARAGQRTPPPPGSERAARHAADGDSGHDEV
jgi:hypothetical protein